MTDVSLAAGLPTLDTHFLASVEKLSAIGDIKLLDRVFLDCVCTLLPVDYALLCLCTAKGRITRIKRYRDPQTRSYQTCWQQEPLDAEQLQLIRQARHAPEGAEAAAGTQHRLAAFSRTSDRGMVVNLLVNYPLSLDGEQLSAFRAFVRIYFNFRGFMDASQRDPLTGLLNRRYFDDCIHRVLDVMQEARSPLSLDVQRRSTDARQPRPWLAILDIDHFKKFNDAYGHLYGDEILLLFSRIMEQTFRETDLLFRFGGEEFVVIMENASAEEAMAALERFRVAVQEYAFPQGEKVTVSCGAIEAVNRSSATALLGKADEALYYAKNHGRNRIVMYEDLLASGALGDPVNTEGAIELF